MLLQNSHGDFSSKQNTLFLYQKFKIVISDDQDCVISDDRSQMDEDGAEPEEIDRDEHRFVVHKIYSGTIHSSCGNNIDLEYTILANDSSLEVFGADLLVWDREGFSE